MALALDPLRSFSAAMALATASLVRAGLFPPFLRAAFFFLATTAFLAPRRALAILELFW